MTSRKVEEENVTSEWQRAYDAMRDPSRVCGRCTHLVTCTVNRGVHRQIVYDYPQVTLEALPFDVNELAKICRYYRRDNVGEDV
jgi:hypothetical protein